MNETDGIVERVDGDYAWVRAAGPGHACGACASRDGCSSAGTLLDGKGEARLLRLPNPIHARPGDAVVIRAAGGVVLRAAWHAYGLPLLLALAFAAGARALSGSDGLAAAGMLLGLGAGFVLLLRRAGEPVLTLALKHPIFDMKEIRRC